MRLINVLADSLSGWPKLDLGEGAFYSVFGFVFVFAGIALLIGIIMLVGFVMTKYSAFKQKKKQKTETVPPSAPAPQIEEGISPEIVAAITAALAVCLEEETGKCEFVVRRIRRI